MSGLRRGKGQTAVEVLLIMAVLLTGLALIVAPYQESNSKVTALAAVRSVSSDIATYLNLGVMKENSPELRPLNAIIRDHGDYVVNNFVFDGVKVQSEGRNYLKILVKFRTVGPANSTLDSLLVDAIGKSLDRTLDDMDGFVREGNAFYYGSLRITLNVTVNERWGVIP
ncbi:hypothetical protein [Thermococcus sp.]